MPPFMTGGQMIEQVTLTKATFRPPPRRFEAGTPPIGPAIGLGAALDWMQALDSALPRRQPPPEPLQRGSRPQSEQAAPGQTHKTPQEAKAARCPAVTGVKKLTGRASCARSATDAQSWRCASSLP